MSMDVEAALRALRAGALRAPECLASGGTQELAHVLQGMSDALAAVTNAWSSAGPGQGTAAEQNGAAANAADAGNSTLEAFEAAITPHMIAASAAAFRCHNPAKPQPFTFDEPDAAAQASELAAIVERVRKAAPGLILALCNAGGGMNAPAKDACEIKLGYQNVFSASISLAGPGRLEVLRIMVDSYDKALELDAWEHTGHTVFRRVSSLAVRALGYFQRRAACWSSSLDPLHPDAKGRVTLPHGVVLEDLLLWLTTYRDLFTRPCCVTGKLLAGDSSTHNPTPPVYRSFKYSRRELLRMSAEASNIKAYHMHVVPEELLDWSDGI